MSIKLKNATFLIKKQLYQELNFEIKDQETKTILYSEVAQSNNFKKILQGYYPLQAGSFKVDGYDMVNKNWTKRKVANITPGDKLIKKWPEKLWMYGSLLVNSAFYANAKENYLDAKYSHLNLASSKNNQTDLEMRNNVEEIVDKFVKTSIEIETNWLDEFFEQISAFNNKSIDESGDAFDPRMKVIIKDYYKLSEKTRNLVLMETFLESLWDKVYSFLDLNSACSCEYNAKRSKQRSEKKLAKELAFHQQSYVIRKRLKIIDIHVRQTKRQIYRNNFVIKSLNKQILKVFLNHINVN
ncbi:hypothetical protein SCLARK_0022 [Spiroplasma clarkii]|uniref:hypothetical protein n=1 Tax=Spiroplasma clarkii TaxID=2139 RepID=UPI000B551769|nr:hypothetical protein [Spiroplasma clarkii]ARU90857.1 hypothetical protein SCLARK_0022 [Spiroplasma clarkii]